MTKLRILDFDIENMPVAYLGPDYTTGIVTAIGWAPYPTGRVESVLLEGPTFERSMTDMLERFRQEYDKADMVTGHYILKHDLPILNRAMLRVGMPPLSQKLVSDTKIHLVKGQHVSCSQENLCELLGLSAGKFHMNAARWERANVAILSEQGSGRSRELSHQRVEGDVRQHRKLREKLIELGHLGPPKEWKP